jgi:hypothetical protein
MGQLQTKAVFEVVNPLLTKSILRQKILASPKNNKIEKAIINYRRGFCGILERNQCYPTEP